MKKLAPSDKLRKEVSEFIDGLQDVDSAQDVLTQLVQLSTRLICQEGFEAHSRCSLGAIRTYPKRVGNQLRKAIAESVSATIKCFILGLPARNSHMKQLVTFFVRREALTESLNRTATVDNRSSGVSCSRSDDLFAFTKCPVPPRYHNSFVARLSK